MLFVGLPTLLESIYLVKQFCLNFSAVIKSPLVLLNSAICLVSRLKNIIQGVSPVPEFPQNFTYQNLMFSEHTCQKIDLATLQKMNPAFNISEHESAVFQQMVQYREQVMEQ